MLLLRVPRLSTSEFLLLLQTVKLVVLVRTALWFFSYDRVRRYFTRQPAVSVSTMSCAKTIQFVDAVSRRTPGATCLTRALAAENLLRRHGYDACLRIGVSKDQAQGLLAHAWVECSGDIVIGGEEASGLTPLTPGVQPCL